ncbi:DUF664 domain-containing protein [Nonomuraea spiralis]|uniref:mycothiol transferase n=1 Tax=Nonomuraea spiralis TaxID=46182 RepID=UPI0037A730CE
MSDSDTPWEPPIAGSEADHLLGALDRLRTTFRWKADGLDAAGLRARVAAALAEGGPEQLVHLSWPDGRHASLRRLLCDLIEEYGRHTGHADLLREAVDGLVGEDPPPGWKPRGAAAQDVPSRA